MKTVYVFVLDTLPVPLAAAQAVHAAMGLASPIMPLEIPGFSYEELRNTRVVVLKASHIQMEKVFMDVWDRSYYRWYEPDMNDKCTAMAITGIEGEFKKFKLLK